MDAKILALDANQCRVIEEFCAHMTSAHLVRQDELHRIDNTDTIIVALHHEFVGD